MKKSLTAFHKTPEWLMRCKYYMLEFIAALLGITVSVFLLDRALFVLAQYSTEGVAAINTFDRMNLSVVAMLLVWVPIAILFFKRARYEELNRPELATTKLRRFFLYVFMLIMLLATIGYAISVIYSLLLFVMGAGTVTETLVQQTIPALVAATLHAYVFRTFMRTNTPLEIREFASFFGTVSAVIFLALLVVTVTQARGALIDENISKDLSEISQKIDLQFQEKVSLPGSLNDLTLGDTLKQRANKYHYKYEKNGLDKYKLCADFKTKNSGHMRDTKMMLDAPIAQPALYPDPEKNFTVHEKGTYCFDLMASGSVMPYAGASGQGSPAFDIDSLYKSESSEAY